MPRKWTLGITFMLTGILLMATGVLLSGRGRAAASDAGAPSDWSQRVIRLHVVANSDSDADQALKRAVRDAILEEVTPMFAGLSSQAEAQSSISSAMPKMEAVAARVVAEHGQRYNVRAELGRYAFPGKAYGTLFLPAGQYTALKVLIGDAAGANWWCILFPPLCFTDWTTGIVQEPKPGTGGGETESAERARPEPVLLDEERLKRVEVRPKLVLAERISAAARPLVKQVERIQAPPRPSSKPGERISRWRAPQVR